MQFNARLISIVAALLLPVFLAGCEERKEPVFGDTTFQLIVPNPGDNVTDISAAKVKVKHSPNIALSGMFLELNGADITGHFYASATSDTVLANLSDVRNSLVQGQNTLIVGEIDQSEPYVNGRPVLVYSETFSFFLDDTPPRLRITSVTPLNANVDGSPQIGSTIIVEGDLVDVSNIASLKFTYPGGSQAVLQTSNITLANNQFNNNTKTFRVSLPNYPDTGVATSAAHFSYTVEDAFEHVHSEKFMASGTMINRQKALQINDSLTWNLSPFVRPLINNALILADSQNLFGVGKPYKVGTSQQPLPGDLIENPMTFCQPSTVADGVIECFPDAPIYGGQPGIYGGSTRIFIYPSDSTQCSSMLFDSSAGVSHCVVFIKDIDLAPDNLDVTFHESNAGNLMVALDLWIGNASVEIEVAGIRVEGADTRYLGGLKGLASLTNFSLATDIKLKTDNFHVIDIDRVTPFHLVLTDLLKVPAVWGTCNICSPLVSPFTLVALALGTDVNNNGKVDKKELIARMGQTIEENVGTVFDTALSNLVMGSTTFEYNEPVNDKQITHVSSIVDAHTVYGNNGHFVFKGTDFVDPAFYAPSYVPVNGGLGSLFAPQGDYYSNFPFIDGWGITSGGVKNIDLSFAVSANSVNQWLLTRHQSGMFDEFELMLTGVDVASPAMAVDPTDELSLTFNTNEAPTVRFKSQDTTSFGICNGTELCYTPNTSSLGAMTIAVNDLDVHLDNITDASVVIDANIDFEITVELSVSSGRPSITLKDNSLRVSVNDLIQPDSLLVSDAMAASAIAEAIEDFMVSPSFQTLLGQKVQTIAISALPGIGGSGVDCTGASVPGEFCVAGQQVPYSSLFVGAIPRDYAVLLRWFTISKAGSYLTFAVDVRNKPAGTWTAQELAENFMTLQITP